jgi:hypothetical protein
MNSKDAKVLVLIGTRKGGFILSCDSKRETWELNGPFFKGWNVMHMILDQRDQRLHAAAGPRGERHQAFHALLLPAGL